MKDYAKIMKNIEEFGERYCKEKKYLGHWNKEKLQNNWWEGLKFLFSHSFMRGRRDKLSNEYYYFTVDVLENYFKINQGLDKSYDNLKKEKKNFNNEFIRKFKDCKKLAGKNTVECKDFMKERADKNPIIHILRTKKEVEVMWDKRPYKKEIFLGNDADIIMVLDVLNFVSNSYDRKSIYNYIKGEITENRTQELYNALDGISYIGDKIAAFIIRDIGLINQGIVDESDYKWAFPVDTWVKKIASKLRNQAETEVSENIGSDFVEECKESNIDPLKFAAGLWYLGVNSLDILLEDWLQNSNRTKE